MNKRFIWNFFNTIFTLAWTAGTIAIAYNYGWIEAIVFNVLVFISALWGAIYAFREHLPGSSYYERNHANLNESMTDIRESLQHYVFKQTRAKRNRKNI